MDEPYFWYVLYVRTNAEQRVMKDLAQAYAKRGFGYGFEPFCPESELSGIGNTELNADCVYTREIEVKKADLAGKLWLKFGAVDYEACVYVNGAFAGKHAGGYTAFDIDITPHVKAGKNRVTVAVHDDVRENVPSGKQTAKAISFGCFYTRVTGIWQTVWLERTPLDYIKSVKFYPDA